MANSMLEQFKARQKSRTIEVDVTQEAEFLETKGGKEYVRFPLKDGKTVAIFFSQEKSMAEFEDALEADGVWPSDVKASNRMWKSGSGYQITDKGGSSVDLFA